MWAFAELGFENATLAVIAQKAGVTAATLPYHFRDKQGLWDAVIEQFYRELLTFGATLTGDITIEDALRRIYLWSEDHRNGIRVIIRNVIETGSLDRTVREHRMGAALEMVAKVIARRLGVGDRPARDAAISVTHLVTRFVTNSPEDNRQAFGVASDEEVRERVVEILVRVSRALLGIG
ncbi:MAG: TetR/AcrR family transcriptional regulator [Myxococcota bacterium]